MVGSTMISVVFSIRTIFDGELFASFPPFALRVNIGRCGGGGCRRRSCSDLFRGRSCCRRCSRRNFFSGCSGSGGSCSDFFRGRSRCGRGNFFSGCSGSGRCGSGGGCSGNGIGAMKLSN